MMQTIQCLDLLIAAMQIANFWNASSFRPFPFPTSGTIHSLRIVLCLGLWYLFVDWFFHWIVQLGMKRWVDADRWCQPILESWMDHSCEKLPLSSYFVLTLLELWLASRVMHCLVFFLSHAYHSNTYITDQKGLMPIAALITLECCFLHMCYLLEEYEIICSWSRLNRFYQDFPGSATADFVQHTWQARGNLILTSNLFISFIVIATYVLLNGVTDTKCMHRYAFVHLAACSDWPTSSATDNTSFLPKECKTFISLTIGETLSQGPFCVKQLFLSFARSLSSSVAPSK